MYGIEPGEEMKPWLWPMPENGIIGNVNINRKDGEKASGRAIYAKDIYKPGMLYAKGLRSPYTHAKIKSMDTSKAEAYPGVRLVLRYDDEYMDTQAPSTLLPLKWRPPLITDTAYWYSQPYIGAVIAADSEQICDEALRLVEIEWEELPVETDWDEAMESGATVVRPDLNTESNVDNNFDHVLTEHGSVSDGFAEADDIIEFTTIKQEDTWAGVGGLCEVVEWQGDYLDIWYTGYAANWNQVTLSEYGVCQESNTSIHEPYCPGQYGGINWFGVTGQMDILGSILAQKTGKPVKMLYDESNFHGSTENGGTIHYKVGYKNDGTITAVELEAYYCCQAMHEHLNRLESGTRIKNLKLTDTSCAINRGPATTSRSGGTSSAVINMVFDHVAGALDMDPTDIALINDGCNGVPMADMASVKAGQGFDSTRDSLKECLEAGKAAIGWDNKWHLPGTKILPNGKYHGLGFIATKEYEADSYTSGSSIALRLRDDGSLRILGRYGDPGVYGQNTYCQVVADVIGLPYEKVNIRTLENPGIDICNGAGSQGMQATLPSMVRAAKKMKDLVLEYSLKEIPASFDPAWGLTPAVPSPFPDMTVDQLDIKDGSIFEKANPENSIELANVSKGYAGMAKSSFNQSPFFVYDKPPLNDAHDMYFFGRLTYFIEVEVDPETGKVDITDVVLVNDVGKVMSPVGVEGQQSGGIAMGLGYSGTEEVIYDPATGVKLNNNLIDYLVPAMNDIPSIKCFAVETGLGYGAYGTFGIGENVTAASCQLTGSAVYNAIGVRIDEFPITPDKILKALGKA